MVTARNHELKKLHSLPVSTNQRMNSFLMEIADACGISKTLIFHMARHTFATTVTLTNGVPIETVSKMLRHRSIVTTQHYAKILDVKIAEDMSKLQEKLDEKAKKNGQAEQKQRSLIYTANCYYWLIVFIQICTLEGIILAFSSNVSGGCERKKE